MIASVWKVHSPVALAALLFRIILQWRPGYQGPFLGRKIFKSYLQEATNFNRFTFHGSIHFSAVGFGRHIFLTNPSFSRNNAAPPSVNKFPVLIIVSQSAQVHGAHILHCVCVLTLSGQDTVIKNNLSLFMSCYTVYVLLHGMYARVRTAADNNVRIRSSREVI